MEDETSIIRCEYDKEKSMKPLRIELTECSLVSEIIVVDDDVVVDKVKEFLSNSKLKTIYLDGDRNKRLSMSKGVESPDGETAFFSDKDLLK